MASWNSRITDKLKKWGGRLFRRPPPTASLQARVISSCIVMAMTLLVFYVGIPLMLPAYLAFALISLNEYADMLALRQIAIRKRTLYGATLLTFPASLPVGYRTMTPLVAGVSWREALLGVVVLVVVGLELLYPKTDHENAMMTVVFSVFGYVYIPWLLGYAITLRYTPDGVLGLWYLTLPVLTIVANDIGAYAVGKLLGKRKLSPQLSPNKTVEGALGGVGMAILTVLGIVYALKFFLHVRLELYDAVIFGMLVAIAAQMGDLFESLIKRWIGVKDAGTIMPGHGGLLDRIDGFFFAVPLTYYFITLVALR